MRLNCQEACMRLCTSGSSMTPRGGGRGYTGIAGCPEGFDSALWGTLSTSVQADGTKTQH